MIWFAGFLCLMRLYSLIRVVLFARHRLLKKLKGIHSACLKVAECILICQKFLNRPVKRCKRLGAADQIPLDLVVRRRSVGQRDAGPNLPRALPGSPPF